MIKFKEFDVGDIHYEEQLEKFQNEHPSAEFVTITGGQTTYEKIWFKYTDDKVAQVELSDNQQIVLGWLKEKYTLTDIEPIELFWRLRANSTKTDYRNSPVYKNYRYMTEIAQLQVLQAFSQWAIERKEGN